MLPTRLIPWLYPHCWMALLLIAGCQSSEPCGYGYSEGGDCPGSGHPGTHLSEGGEIRHENVRILGKIQTWILVYQYTGPSKELNAPFPTPAAGGGGQFGNCVDERQSATWPFHPITGATFLELPRVELTGPGITGTLTIPRSPPHTVGNLTGRTYDISYGGGALNAADDVTGFNATLTPVMATPGGVYTLDIGKRGGPGTDGGTKMTYHMPEAYTPPLGLGGPTTVMFPAHQPLELTWTPPPQHLGPDGEHIRETHFNSTLFFDTANTTNPPQFICFPDKDGHQLIPTTVIDALPATGIIVNADLSHYMDAREAAPGEFRRFDLVSTYSNISAYSRQ
jgi:hypothetical protein